jgi:hypothetical protein
LAASLLTASADALGAMVKLGGKGTTILNELVMFANMLDESEHATKLAIQVGTGQIAPLLAADGNTSDMRQIQVRSGLVMLAALESEISYLLFDRQAAIQSRTERGLAHLQRTIAIDDSVRDRWSRAFDAGEVECEKLGAVHLLGHGIWAFKANASGERTDLVYQEPLKDLAIARRSADGLVLTEWKKLPDGANPGSYLESARTQMKCYSQGVLAGFELTRVRYAILVSRKDSPVPDDVSLGGVTYRHINIAIEPRAPSRR